MEIRIPTMDLKCGDKTLNNKIDSKTLSVDLCTTIKPAKNLFKMQSVVTNADK